jgi:hypothetical protein
MLTISFRITEGTVPNYQLVCYPNASFRNNCLISYMLGTRFRHGALERNSTETMILSES